jgi:hypothetical protein
MGGFDRWERVVGGILAHAGVSGFLGNLDQLYEEADEEDSSWETFLELLAPYLPHPKGALNIATILHNEPSIALGTCLGEDDESAKLTKLRESMPATSRASSPRLSASSSRSAKASATVTWACVSNAHGTGRRSRISGAS